VTQRILRKTIATYMCSNSADDAADSRNTWRKYWVWYTDYYI